MFLVCVVCDEDVFDVVPEAVLSVVVAFLSLIDSLAHHSEREMIVTHGKFRLLAIEKLKNTIQNIIDIQILRIVSTYFIIIEESNKHKSYIKFFFQNANIWNIKILSVITWL